MNPEYDPKKDNLPGRNGNWVFKAILPTKDAQGRNNEQYFYTGTKLSQNRAHKFDLVQKLIAKETKMVSTWRRDLMGKNQTNQILAAQCELIYDTCARVGGVGNANRNGQTFGLTTLSVGNVKRRGTTLVLDYLGKDSVQQRHILKPETPAMRKVISVLQMLIADRSRKEPLWDYDGTVYNANKLRLYFRQVTGIADASPHKLRHVRGTRLASTELDLAFAAITRAKKAPTQRAVDDAFKDALTNVGRILGHVKGVGSEQKTVWTTAAKNYVDVGVMTDFYAKFADFGVRAPSFLAKLKG
jgi:DNA topoisomerase IB